MLCEYFKTCFILLFLLFENKNISKRESGAAGEMALQFKAPTALLGTWLRFVASTWQLTTISDCSYGDPAPSSGLPENCTYAAPRHVQAKHRRSIHLLKKENRCPLFLVWREVWGSYRPLKISVIWMNGWRCGSVVLGLLFSL